MFKTSYDFFGFKLICEIIKQSKPFNNEKCVYKHVDKTYFDWHSKRMETVGQDGFPDMLLMKGSKFLLVEGKMLKKKRLVNIEDDLRFEFGQLPFMMRCLERKNPYLLVVAKENKIAYIGEKTCLERYLLPQLS